MKNNKNNRVTVCIDDKDFTLIDKYCSDFNMTYSQFIRIAIKVALSKFGGDGYED